MVAAIFCTRSATDRAMKRDHSLAMEQMANGTTDSSDPGEIKRSKQ